MLDWTIWRECPGGRGTVTYLAACMEQDAAYIVHAANLHPSLVQDLADCLAALRALWQLTECHDPAKGPCAGSWAIRDAGVFATARAVLARLGKA